MVGRPFLANAQSAVLSPFNAPAYVVPRRPYLVLAAVLKVFVAAFGTFLLSRALGLRFAGALMAGLVYGFAQLTVESVSWPQGASGHSCLGCCYWSRWWSGKLAAAAGCLDSPQS